jgi:ligand-binding sensor domain-containing protein
MKTNAFYLNYITFIFLATITIPCNSQVKSKTPVDDKINANSETSIESPTQIGEYVVATFEDSKGNLWFGTLEKGVARYDGKELRYFTTSNGLPSNRIVSIIEDKLSNLWFGTGAGISKFDGKGFTNFGMEAGLDDTRVSKLFIDSRETFWIGTWGGVYIFNGSKFTKFTLPNPSIKTALNEDTKGWITEIMEDSKGNIWFGRDAYGASKFDGKTFLYFLKEDGLYSNNVQGIIEDKDGNIWFGSRVAEKDNADDSKRIGKGGVTMYNGNTFSHFPEIAGLNNNDVYEIYRDNDDNVWIGTINNGVYKYNGKEFVNYDSPKSVVSIVKDNKGSVWIGCAGGLFCINSSGIVNVKTNGPWK